MVAYTSFFSLRSSKHWHPITGASSSSSIPLFQPAYSARQLAPANHFTRGVHGLPGHGIAPSILPFAPAYSKHVVLQSCGNFSSALRTDGSVRKPKQFFLFLKKELPRRGRSTARAKKRARSRNLSRVKNNLNKCSAFAEWADGVARVT